MFVKVIEMEIYENFFRSFCKKKDVDSDSLLRADFRSFNEGLKYWYDGCENRPLARLIFMYLSKNKENHLITFSEFIYFIRQLTLAEGHINLMIFKFLTEGGPNLEILQIVRHYVSTPKNSAFADELSKLMRHYIS